MSQHQQLSRIKQLLANNQLAEAARDAGRLSENLPEDAAWHSELGLIFNELQDHQKALTFFQKAIALAPRQGDHYYNLATVQRFLGQRETAEQNLLHAVRLNPHDHEAWGLLSQLKTQTSESNHIAQLRDILEQLQHPAQRVAILFALAKELEDIGDYNASFDALSQGANLRRQHMQYDVNSDIAVMQTIAEAFPAEHCQAASRGYHSPDPIFIIGLPRSGTTLVERILSSHSDVHSCGELNNFALCMMEQIQTQQLQSQDRLGLIRQSAKLNFAPLGQAYLNSLGSLRGSESRVIDKLPFNYLYAGLIHKALPKAKIIHVQRDPLDSCYAIYKQLFQNAYPFSYQLTELADYFIAYQQLMDHWYAALPGVMHSISYENLVNNTESEIRTLLQYCDLPFEDECLQFYQNKNASTTASASQIRTPIYNSSIGKWRHYRRQLQPLADKLQNAGIPFHTEEIQ
ncbi:MAG: sulfotransferase [Aestuariibacter sp.]